MTLKNVPDSHDPLMNNMIRISDLDSLRPKKVRILIVQTTTDASDWEQQRGLWVPSASADFSHWIELALG